MSLPGDQVAVSVVPRTKARVEVSDFDIEYILGNSSYTYDQVCAFVQTILNETLELTIKETEEWIDEFVPKRSGDLIESLKHFLGRSRPPPIAAGEIRGIRLILGSGADVKYAKYVIKMSDEQVQHNATWYEHSGKKAYSKGKPVFLDDPHAIGAYHEKMIEYAKERLKTNLTKIKWLRVRSG